ncbi:MAG: flagellar filament capping protein FliD [Gammaproteobacteria bacterium]|nr:flagellar filament capping protein FliD [Gammaproteobacteria bacterium]
MPSISTSGIGSGIDINNLVSQLVAAEREPVETRLDTRETTYQAQLSAFGLLKSALSDFSQAVDRLKLSATFDGRTAASENEDVFTATATQQAANGRFQVKVEQLAAAQKQFSEGYADADTTVGTGKLTIDVNGLSFDVSIETGGNTLNGIRDAINAAPDNTGVTATIIKVDDGSGGNQSKLVLTADKMGSDGQFTVTVDDDDGTDTDTGGLSRLIYGANATTRAAVDAQISIDDQILTRTSNTISDAIEGITFNLVTAKPGESINLIVSTDTQAAKNTITDFVDRFNDVVDLINNSTNYDTATGATGTLFSDSTVRGLESGLRNALSSQVTGSNGTLRSLAELGIVTDQDGKLSVEESTLDAALAQNLESVTTLFTSTSGVALRAESILNGFADTNGIIDSRIDGLNKGIEDITDQRANLDRRMQSIQDRLSAQFTAMDVLVNQLRTTGDFLTQQLAGLSAMINGTDK